MIEFNAGEVLASAARRDRWAEQVVSEVGQEAGSGSTPETLDQALRQFDRRADSNLPLQLWRIAVPDGEEVWWANELIWRYVNTVLRDRDRPAEFTDDTMPRFAASPHHLLSECALTFSIGPHDPAYRVLLNEKASSGDGTGVRIKVIDSGLSSQSSIIPTLKTNLVDPANPQDVEDADGHGTAVAEIIASLAPRADFLVYKVKGHAAITEWDVLAALCDGTPADLVNLSLSFGLQTVQCASCGRASHSARSTVFEGVLRSLRQVNPDTIIVAAAGNKATTPIAYPARFREAVAIGALDSSATQASFSNYGNLDQRRQQHDSLFFAPGGGGSEYVGHTHPGGKAFQGTSFAAAYATGLLARALSDPALPGSAAMVLAHLQRQSFSGMPMRGFAAADHGHGLLQL